MPRALCSSGLPLAPGTRIMSPKAVKMTLGCCGDRKSIVDASHRQHAHGATGTMYQFDVVREQILKAETVDGMRVAAADFHQTIVAARIGDATDFCRRLHDGSGFAKLVHKFHGDRPETPWP